MAYPVSGVLCTALVLSAGFLIWVAKRPRAAQAPQPAVPAVSELLMPGPVKEQMPKTSPDRQPQQRRLAKRPPKNGNTNTPNADKPVESAPRPAPPGTVNNCPNGICISGGTVIGPTVNNGPKPPQITWTSRALDPSTAPSDFPTEFDRNPGAMVEVVTHGPFSNPVFVVQCSAPCRATAIDLYTNGISAPQLFGTNRLDFTAAGFSLPSLLESNSRVQITVRSLGSSGISIVSALPYVRQ